MIINPFDQAPFAPSQAVGVVHGALPLGSWTHAPALGGGSSRRNRRVALLLVPVAFLVGLLRGGEVNGFLPVRADR